MRVVKSHVFFTAWLGALGSLGAEEIVTEYLPVSEPGRIWKYEVTKSRHLKMPDRNVEEQLSGATVEQTKGAIEEPKFPKPVVLLVQQVSETNHTTGRMFKSTVETYLSVSPGEIMMHGQEIQGMPGLSPKLVRFPSPVALLKLPLPKEGEAFPSINESHGMVMDSRPYEQGWETVKTAAGTFEKCLRIRARGPISGALPGPGSPAIEEGRIEETSWFAKGVGLVKQVQRIWMVVRLPNSQSLTMDERKEKSLTEHRGPHANPIVE